jgi:hypothetical protein
MVDQSIHFDDGAAYERFMGQWSQLAGETFLDLACATARFAMARRWLR